MASLRILMVLLVGAFMAVSATAGAENWYVVKHKSGQTAVTDHKPGKDWSMVSGPYQTQDEAARAGGVNPNMDAANIPRQLESGRKQPSSTWYVVKHKSGQTAVIDYKPGKDWSIVSGPYASKDEAARAGAIDPATEPSGIPGRLSAQEGQASSTWYVVKHKSGQTTVTDYRPGHDWSIVSGPYKARDEAARAGGVNLPGASTMSVPREGD